MGSEDESGLVEPRVKSIPEGEPSALAIEALDFLRQVGVTLDDWQEMILAESLRQDEAGLWSSFEVGVDLARQNGKGGLLEGRQLVGLFLLGEPLQVYSSHQFDTSLEAFRRLWDWIDEKDELRSRVKRVARSHGEEGIELVSGPRIRFRTRTKGGGRGFSCDCLYLDEAMIISEFAHGALLPTLSARKNPQVWYAGSAVDQLVHEHGVVFARVRERGHRGDDPRLSYYEWSAPFDHPNDVTDEVAQDHQMWKLANPTLGDRIRVQLVENEQRSMDPRTFAVERLGVGDWPRTDRATATVIDLDEWARLKDPGSVLGDSFALAFDVSPERKASISAAGHNQAGLWHVEVLQSQPGTKWLLDRIPELVERHNPSVVVCDGYGPSAAFIAPLAEVGVEVEAVTAADHARACARFLDFISEGSIRHLGSLDLVSAIRVAQTRPLGDAWAWSRRSSTGNISPLVSATLALSGAVEHPPMVAWAAGW